MQNILAKSPKYSASNISTILKAPAVYEVGFETTP
jgi:hypothetical protein